jgi:hypothetical protein
MNLDHMPEEPPMGLMNLDHMPEEPPMGLMNLDYMPEELPMFIGLNLQNLNMMKKF